jgi:hypothetical protein
LVGQFRKSGITTPRDLASKFNVSLDAINLRLGIKK